MSFTDRTKKRRFCQLLAKFLNVCDYMTINALHKILSRAFNELAYVFEVHEKCSPTMEELGTNLALNCELEVSRPNDAPQSPFIKAQLVLKPKCIEVDPSRSVMTQQFQQFIELMRSVIFDFERFQTDVFYKKFTE